MEATQLEPVRHNMKPSRLDDSLFSKDLAPHYMKLAGQLASSELVPKSFRGKPQDLFLCWAMGYQIGIPPEQAMQCIAIVNGKAVMWGDEMLALCMSHPEFDDIIEEPIISSGDTITGYRCTVKRTGKADKESVFTLDMAKKAGLLAKGGVWTQYPERMLKLRARGFCLRDAFPDALKGIKSREEVEDYIDAEYSINSRAERLKQDIIAKQGANDVEAISRPNLIDENQVTHEVNAEEPRQEVATGQETADLHSEVKRLIATHEFTEERLAKALKFYEVNSIEDLQHDAATHFIQKLNKYKEIL